MPSYDLYRREKHVAHALAGKTPYKIKTDKPLFKKKKRLDLVWGWEFHIGRTDTGWKERCVVGSKEIRKDSLECCTRSVRWSDSEGICVYWLSLTPFSFPLCFYGRAERKNSAAPAIRRLLL